MNTTGRRRQSASPEPTIVPVSRLPDRVLTGEIVLPKYGLTRGAVRQIGRARTAALLLTSGEAVGDVVDKLGYYDEPHLARALRRYVGRTAQQLRTGEGGAIALDTGQRTTS
ncbi:AraC family transcriptional regulator [Nocardia sp. NPDC004568]|uniref:AraC family transcriptional regulator n=1 Tax=Nocardia sp. NPDC004568 TaxID=3154551 RepID=UPI0033A83480